MQSLNISGFTGTNCEINIDDCEGNVCQVMIMMIMIMMIMIMIMIMMIMITTMIMMVLTPNVPDDDINHGSEVFWLPLDLSQTLLESS